MKAPFQAIHTRVQASPCARIAVTSSMKEHRP